MTLKRPLGLAFFVALASCTPGPSSNSLLTIGVNGRASKAFICLVEKENARRGRQKKWKSVAIDRSDDGLDMLSSGEIDIAISAAPSFFSYALRKPNEVKKFKIIAGINNVQNSFTVVASKKSGIKQVKDLSKKRLGHSGEISNFFRTYFFITEGIIETSLKQFDFKSDERTMQAIEDGEIDVAVVSEEISKIIDPKKYHVFYSSVHEITSQVIVPIALIKSHRAELLDFIENMISVENELYLDEAESMRKLKECLPNSNEDILRNLLRRRELRVLLDESLRAQYALYKKWLISKNEYRNQADTVRKFSIDPYIDFSLLKSLDFRRVLIK